MHTPSTRPQFRVLLLGFAMFAASGWAAADPPSRAARLGYVQGAVSFSPAGEDDWVQATLNRPLTTGDRLWADADARAEVQVGGAALRIGAATSVTLLNLDDDIAQVQVDQGTLKIRVRQLGPGQAFEVDTPNLAFTLRQPGDYRVEVDPAGNATAVMVQSGRGDVYGDGASYVVDAGRGYRFTGTDLRDYQPVDALRNDDFDRWASERDRRDENSASARYVSSDVVGYEDLDANGTWRTDPVYGSVWIPNRVAAGWTPYHDGHWAWVDPWGWTWVDDAPWGYAVSHYGRWANLRGTWGWVPGPRTGRAVYAPALVVFVGGGNFQLSISLGGGGAVGWFPLAPRDVYRPSYAASRGYFDRINRSNTAINDTAIANVYNNRSATRIVYGNRQVPGAVVAVPTTAFVRAQPVRTAAVQLSKQSITSAPVSSDAAVAPVQQSVHGAAAPGAKPPTRQHGIVARSAPPTPTVGLAAQQQQLAARPGRPLDEAARRGLKPVAPVPAPKVTVVAAAQVKPPTAPPPAAAEPAKRERVATPAAAPQVERAAVTPPPSATPPPNAAPPPSAAPPVRPPASLAQAPQRTRREPPVQEKARAAPARIEQPPVTPPPSATAPPVRAPVPVAQAPQRARPQLPVQAIARPVPPVVIPPQVRAPPIVSPPILRPVPAAPAPQRARPEPRVQPAAAPQVAPPPVRPPAAQPPAPKPAPVAPKSAEQKKAEEEAHKRKP